MMIGVVCIEAHGESSGYDNSSYPCSVDIKSYMYPIEYDSAMRSNPDGTLYPGDAFHYLFFYSGLQTCQNFHAETLLSEGEIDLLSHVQYKNENHPHTHLETAPKKFSITNFHKLIGYEEKRQCRGQHCSYYKSPVYSESSSFSIRWGENSLGSQYTLDGVRWSYIKDDFTASTQHTHPQSILAEQRELLSEKACPRCGEYSTFEQRDSEMWDFANFTAAHHYTDKDHLFESDSSLLSFEGMIKQMCSELKVNQGCVFGHAEIDVKVGELYRKCLKAELEKLHKTYSNIRDICINVDHQISLGVVGDEVHCKNGTCEVTQKKKSAIIKVNIRSPIPDVIFERPPIKDTEGYDSKNIDSTYYVWDLPALHLMPEMSFREVRNDTISFNVTRINTPIAEIFTENCSDVNCLFHVSGANISDTSISAVNGDRLDVFRAETLDEQGLRTFPYEIRVYNIASEEIDREISYTTSSIDTLIADYTPIFSEYYFPYVILNSPGDTTLEKLHGVSLHYLGSRGTGPGDDDTIHPERRSKINDSSHTTAANTLGRQYELDSTLVMKGGHGIVDIASSVYPSILESLGVETLGVYPDSLVSINDSAVFTNEGYGRMAFFFEGISEEAASLSIANITSYNTLLSANFGGYDETPLYSYSYYHPGSYVSSTLNVTAINSDGTINNDTHIDVNLQLDTEMEKTIHLSRYMESHIANSETLQTHNGLTPFDSAKEFAAMYLGDMHNVTNKAEGRGTVILPINLPAVRILPETYLALGITDELSFTSLGEEFAYSSPVSYNLHVTANDITNVIPYYPYGFSNTINYTINSDDGNSLDSIRYLSSVHISSPDSFGEIKEITINGEKYGGLCSKQCLLSINGNSTIHAENIWGGSATLEVIEQRWNSTGGQYEMVMAYVDSTGPIIILISVMFSVLFLYAKFASSK